MNKEILYVGREQTFVKHYILEHYLERFAIIVGTHWKTLTYIDCFSGPWNVQSENFEDSSFSIALEQLRKAQRFHSTRTGRSLILRCFFLEKSPSAFKKLKEFTETITDVEIEVQNNKLEDAIPLVQEFIKKGGRGSFPFVFIDPTGWSGFAMNTIAPLLQLEPGEVLINFMTEHISRFIDSPQIPTQTSFKKLFGSGDFKSTLKGLSSRDREDTLVQAYSENVKRTGRFKYVSSALVLHPEENRTNFHLIYATRNPKGVMVFKDTEKRAMGFMQVARGEAQRRKRENRTGQGELFGGKDAHDSAYFNELRRRYTTQAKKYVLNFLKSNQQVLYDEIWALAMKIPLCWEVDLKKWISDWKKENKLEIIGMQKSQRVPKLGQAITLVWKD